MPANWAEQESPLIPHSADKTPQSRRMFIPQSKLPHVGTTIFTVITQRARERGAINLAQGFPDFEPPLLLKDCLARAVTGGNNQYAPMTGVEALREQIAKQLQALHISMPSTDYVTVTLGATEGLFSSVLALVQTDDEVIVFDPCYDSYGPAIELCGARAVHVPLVLPDFHVDWQRVRDSITPRTRMIIINSPHNPSGAVINRDDLNTLAELVRDTNIIVLSDEVYANMIFDGAEHLSMQAHPELRERSISVFSFGKVLHATGWRVGYAIAPPLLTQELRRVHQFNTFSIAAPLQLAITEFLQTVPGHIPGLAAFYQNKRDYFLKLLAASRFKFVPSFGTYFQLLDYSAIADEDDTRFADYLLSEVGVAAIPLSPFYANPPRHRYLRFCFAKTENTLQTAAEKLAVL